MFIFRGLKSNQCCEIHKSRTKTAIKSHIFPWTAIQSIVKGLFSPQKQLKRLKRFWALVFHCIQKKKQRHSASNSRISEETWRLSPPTAELIDKEPGSDSRAADVFQERGPISEMFWKLTWRRRRRYCCSGMPPCICGWEAVLVDLWRDSQDFPHGCTLWVLCNRIPLKKKGLGSSRGPLAIFSVSFWKRTCWEVYVWSVSLQDLFLCLCVCVHLTTREDFYCLPGDILFLVTNVRLHSNGVLLEAAAIIMLQRCSQDKCLQCRYCPES